MVNKRTRSQGEEGVRGEAGCEPTPTSAENEEARLPIDAGEGDSADDEDDDDTLSRPCAEGCQQVTLTATLGQRRPLSPLFQMGKLGTER